MRYSGPDVKCIVTQQMGSDLHHVITRGAGGSDHPANLMPLCHLLHQEVHLIGLVKLSNKYPQVQAWLIDNGWEMVLGKWYHPHARYPLK